MEPAVGFDRFSSRLQGKNSRFHWEFKLNRFNRTIPILTCLVSVLVSTRNINADDPVNFPAHELRPPRIKSLVEVIQTVAAFSLTSAVAFAVQKDGNIRSLHVTTADDEHRVDETGAGHLLRCPSTSSRTSGFA